MKNKWWIVLRIVVFLIIGLLYTVFLPSEESGTWKYYFGFFLLLVVWIDVVRLVKTFKK